MLRPLRVSLRLALLLVASAPLVAACGVTGQTVPLDAAPAAPHAPVDASTLPLFATGAASRPYVLVGFLAADAPTSDEAIAELRRRAAALGGDAIVALDVSLGGPRGVHATGAAVRYS
jgi:hypothetical protein